MRLTGLLLRTCSGFVLTGRTRPVRRLKNTRSPMPKLNFALLRSSVPAGRVQLIRRSGLTRCPGWAPHLATSSYSNTGTVEGTFTTFKVLPMCLFVPLESYVYP